MDLDSLKSKIRSVYDWPKKGVVFRDITPILEDRTLFRFLVDELAGLVKDYSQKIDKVVGIDARGFILAATLAYKLKTGLAIVRKKGKLPSATVSRRYTLEYAAETLQMHKDAIKPGEKVLLVDDVLATGGTMAATVDIVKQLNGQIVAILFFLELDELGGRERLRGQIVKSLIHF